MYKALNYLKGSKIFSKAPGNSPTLKLNTLQDSKPEVLLLLYYKFGPRSWCPNQQAAAAARLDLNSIAGPILEP